MNATIVIKVAAACLAAALLAACASTSNPAPAGGQLSGNQLAGSPAAPAVAKLTKNLTGEQVLGLLGPPRSTKPITAGGMEGKIWSYSFQGPTQVQMIAVATQEVPAMNPLTGQSTTRTEPVFENQSVQVTDTLHLLIVDNRLIEWSVMRDEKKDFQ